MANNGEAPQGTVKDRVLSVSESEGSRRNDTEARRSYSEIAENLRLLKLKTFKGQIQSKVRSRKKIKEDLQFKHAFIVVQISNSRTSYSSKGAKCLWSPKSSLDHRMAALEDAVGTD